MKNRHEFAIFLEGQRLFRSPVGSTVVLADPEVYFRMTRVLRLESGSEVVLFDDSKSFFASVIAINKKDVVCKLVREISVALGPIKIHLYLSFLKKSAFEEAIYFAVEAGVNSITPVISEKCHPYFWSDKEAARLKKLIISAREQSKFFEPVALNNPLKIEQIGDSSITKILFCDPDGKPFLKAYESIMSQKTPCELALLIGPEAGFSISELQKVLALENVVQVALTGNILRAPEAVLLAAGILRLKS